MNHVLLTGGTGLFGKIIVKALLESGYKVTFTTRSIDKGNQLLAKHNHSHNLEFKVVEFVDEQSITSFLDDCVNTGFTHLINNARSIESLRVSNNLTSCSSMQQEFFLAVILPYMLSTGFIDTLKSIVNISSMYGVVPPNRNLYLDGYNSSPIQYGIAKSAQIHLTKELAVRLSERNVRVNSVSFGGIEGRVDSSFKERYSKLCPQGRMLVLEEIIEPILFLLDKNKSSGMTGHNLVVDGGWSTW